MKYLFFTNTPAHVHLYKHAVAELRERGHEVLILGRNYGCTASLLEYYDLPYRIYGGCDTTKTSLFRSLPSHYFEIAKQVRQYRPDLIFGVGAYSAHAGALAGVPVVLILDSEPTGLDHAISRPFATLVLTPRVFGKDLGEKHYRFRGFKECAYLHPDVYESEVDIREALGVGEGGKYVILRLNAFGSHHDVSHSGLTPARRRDLIERLAEHATVFVSDEGRSMDYEGIDARPFDLHPGLIHDALAEAHLLVADTQTMVTEAALLGTPAIRSNSFVGDGDMGNFLELARNDLIYNIADFDAVIAKAIELITDDAIPAIWRERRDAYMADTVNLTELIVNVALNRAVAEEVEGLSRQPVLRPA
jgi:predicted glycosyltransferase